MGDQLAQLSLSAGSRQGGVTDVVLEVRVGGNQGRGQSCQRTFGEGEAEKGRSAGPLRGTS